jgi:predicted 2-oxoglutarate/Fe(II)-dependent dioxygenase YbiX
MYTLQDRDGRWIGSLSYGMAGHALVLAVCRRETDLSDTVIRALDAAHPQLTALGARVFATIPVGVDATRDIAGRLAPPFGLLADASGDFAAVFFERSSGTAEGPILVAVDPNSRILSIRDRGPMGARLAAAMADLRALAAAQPGRTLAGHAPVLVLPRVLNAEDCAYLVDVWHRPVNVWTSELRINEAHVHDSGDCKIRQDAYGRTEQFVVADPAVHNFIHARIARRLLPEMAKAFQVDVQYCENYRIACYDSAEGSSLPPHRDNPTPQTQHRLFTISINLNAGAYDGGALRFPEYGPQLYEVERGAAVVWSCTLLHEVTEVTRGRRFILATHFFNDLDAARQRGLAHGQTRSQGVIGGMPLRT